MIGEWLDVYEEVTSEILYATKFVGNSDSGATYLGRIDIIRSNKIKEQENFPVSEQGNTIGKLVDGTEYQIPLDTGASISLLSKIHYFRGKSLHVLPKFYLKHKVFS